jgi:hypothetical protein
MVYNNGSKYFEKNFMPYSCWRFRKLTSLEHGALQQYIEGDYKKWLKGGQEFFSSPLIYIKTKV